MIPYFNQPSISIGPLSIHAFGVLVAIGLLLGIEIIRRRAPRLGLDAEYAVRLTTWILVAGFIGAHLVDRLVYYPGETLRNPISLLQIWKGISSFGGFLGAVAGLLLFFRLNPPPGKGLWRYLDLVAYAFPVGWVFGRTGCFVAFDHPGILTSSFLGQMDQDGQVRFNLGLMEALWVVPIMLLFLWLGRRPRRPGLFIGLLPLLYAPFRFMADTLRVADVRYGGFTPGQYGSVALLVTGVLVLWASRSRQTASKK